MHSVLFLHFYAMAVQCNPSFDSPCPPLVNSNGSVGLHTVLCAELLFMCDCVPLIEALPLLSGTHLLLFVCVCVCVCVCVRVRVPPHQS